MIDDIQLPIIHLADILTPEAIALFEKAKAQTQCPWCKGPMNGIAQSFFTWEIICAKCWYKELEVQRKLKRQGKDIKTYENIGKVPKI